MQKNFRTVIRLLPRNACVIGLSLILILQTDTFDNSLRTRLAATTVTGPVFVNFRGPAGAPPNSAYWTVLTGNQAGSQDGELENYTASPTNVRLDGQGDLALQAVPTATGYTSGRVISNFNMGYGTVTARIKFPTGMGIWPAFWMLGSGFWTTGWPQCGEIDILEMANTGTNWWSALHGPAAANTEWSLSAYDPSNYDVTQGFHNYWVTRAQNSITVGIDSSTLANYTPSSLPAGGQWVFNDNPMFVIFNIAVGGPAGSPDVTTPFPATMLINSFSYTPLTGNGGTNPGAPGLPGNGPGPAQSRGAAAVAPAVPALPAAPALPALPLPLPLPLHP